MRKREKRRKIERRRRGKLKGRRAIANIIIRVSIKTAC